MGIFDKLEAAKEEISAYDELMAAIKTKQLVLIISGVGGFIVASIQAALLAGFIPTEYINFANATSGFISVCLATFIHKGTTGSTDKITATGRANPVAIQQALQTDANTYNTSGATSVQDNDATNAKAVQSIRNTSIYDNAGAVDKYDSSRNSGA